MTALAGYWSFEGNLAARARCERMLKGQQIYGPREPVISNDLEIVLGGREFHRERNAPPRSATLRGADETLLVADIRLDNRDELTDALGVDRRQSRSMSDVAILLQALQRWDEAAVERLIGDFAFAYWNPARRRLLLARDFLGQRPLHYHADRRFFAFASMPKGLHALPEVPVKPDRDSVAAFLALIPEDGTETYFEGISKVRAGHLLWVTRDGLRSERYWQPQPRELRLKRPEDYAEALREQVDRAVAARLPRDRNRVAAHLSCGLDSSVVAASAARLLDPDGRVVAFTAVPRPGYPVGDINGVIADEGPMAGEVAAMHPNMEHVLVPSGGSPLASLARHFFLYERPVLNLSNSVWSEAILDIAKQQDLDVLLTGQRGNMSFSFDGLSLLSQLLRQGRLIRFAKESWLLGRHGTRARTIAAQSVGPLLPRWAWDWTRRVRGSGGLHDYTALNPEAVSDAQLAELARERGLSFSYQPRGDPFETRLWALRRVDHGNYNKGTLAGWGIDVRDPTGDRRVVEFCLSVPMDQYLRRGVRRALVRSAFADRLPASVLRLTVKGRQAVDWHEGLSAARDDIGEEVAAIGACPDAARTIDVRLMQRLVESWPEGGWHERAVVARYRLALLRGISAGRFIRQAMGANR